MKIFPRSAATFQCIFLLVGAGTVLLSLLLANAGSQPGRDVWSGNLLGTQFCGQMIGSLLLTRRSVRSLAAGLLTTAVTAAALAWVSAPVQWLLLLLGVGLGLVMAAVNTAAAQQVPRARRASTLELLNVFWPIGAALAVAAERMFRRSGNAWRMYGVLAGLFVVCAVWLWATKEPCLALGEELVTVERRGGWSLVALLCLLAMMAVGVETGIASWLPTFGGRYGFSSRVTAGATTAYWCGSLLSRGVTSLVLRKIALRWICICAATGTILCTASLPIVHTDIAFLFLAAVTACCIAPLYPALLTECIDLRGKGLVFMSAGLGAALLPWLIGETADVLDSLRGGMFVVTAGAMLLGMGMWKARMFEARDADAQ